MSMEREEKVKKIGSTSKTWTTCHEPMSPDDSFGPLVSPIQFFMMQFNPVEGFSTFQKRKNFEDNCYVVDLSTNSKTIRYTYTTLDVPETT